MVRTSRSPTDVAAVAPSSSSSVAAASSSSASSSSANSSPYEFLSGNGGGNSDSGLGFADLDVAFTRVVAAEDAKQSCGLLLDAGGAFDVEMHDFDLGDDDRVYGDSDVINISSFTRTTSTSAKASKTTTTTKQPRKEAAATAKKSAREEIKQETGNFSNSNSEDSTADAAALHNSQQEGEVLSTLELRRKRNRDSMRRARHRQRNEQEKLETMIDQLEDRLEALMHSKENSLAMSTVSSTNGTEESTTSYSYSAYSSLLRQTEELRDQNDELSEQIRKHAHFQERIGKLADQEQKQLESEIQADEADEDHALLQPLLQWVTHATVIELVSYSRDRILEVADLTNTLVPTTNNVLGWEGRRTIHANWAHYTMTKSFLHESSEWLAKRTWECTVNQDVGEMKQVLSWANGTKVLHRLSSDAVIIARDMLVPNLQDMDHPIRIRYILLVFRTPLPDDGFLVGTETLNVYGTSVEECLEQKVSLAHGMSALTMYAFLFTRVRSPETGADLGCNVTLAGRSGDGSLMYARKVLFEVLPSILRWENTFVAPILRVTG